MIIDSHCHAWRRWPFQPPVPDPERHGDIRALLWEMDRWEVDRALLVCARVEDNDDNNEYGAEAARANPERIVQIADIDGMWSDTYHTPGAADRLRHVAERHPIAGITHYVSEPDGWFATQDGLEFFAAAAELDLVVSIAAAPSWQGAIREVAHRFPTLPILCHHLGGLTAETGVGELLESAQLPNIALKVSGFHYASERSWDFPYGDAVSRFRPVAEAFGPSRLAWGSDFPVSKERLTYRQTLEVVRSHCDFFTDGDLSRVLGETMAQILETRRPVG